MSDKTSKEQMQTEELQADHASEEQSVETQIESGSEDQTTDPAKELAEAQDKYLRLAAEFENFKKRSARERAEWINSANDQLIVQLLDVVDNFERALGQTEESLKHENADKEKLFHSLSDGARMIHEQLKKALAAHGVEEISALGEPFDPDLHEAALSIETENTEPDHVAQVLSKGYARGKRILRHAKVGVAKAKEEQG